MASSEEPSAAPRRPALVEELERMGFRPAEPPAPTSPASEPTEPSHPLEPPALVDPHPTDPHPTDPPARLDPPPPVAAPRPDRPSTSPSSGSAPLPDRPRREPGELTADAVLRHRAEPPAGGWRKALYVSTFRLLNPAPSAAERRQRDLIARAQRPVPGCWRVAVLSLKGGVGKTTTTAALGVQLATLRGDRVVAVDANPDRGTLAEKVPQVNPATVRDLLRDRERVLRYSDVRAYTSMSPSRLEVLASDADPTASQAFSDADYRSVIGVLEHFYSLILTDCGTGLLHNAMSGVLGLADALVVVTSANLDGARSASATLDWLEAHGKAHLVAQSVAVVSSVRPSGGLVDVDAVQEHFARRCRAVVRVPYDRHLEAGADISLEAMGKPTRQAWLELAAAVGDGLP